MSAIFVRNTIKSFINTNVPSDVLIDLTAEFRELRQMLADQGVNRNDDWLAIQFIAPVEVPITIQADNTTGKYREEGIIYIHVVTTAAIGAGNNLLTRAEALRTLFRGQNISGIRVESVSPPNFEAENTLQFEGGWTACSVLVAYEYDVNL